MKVAEKLGKCDMEVNIANSGCSETSYRRRLKEKKRCTAITLERYDVLKKPEKREEAISDRINENSMDYSKRFQAGCNNLFHLYTAYMFRKNVAGF